MRDEDKPFVCYRQGWSMKIVPRNGAGWRALALWLAMLGALAAVFAAGMIALRGEVAQVAATAGFIALSLLWAVAMIRWMMARSEVVDLDELLELKRQRDKRRR